MINRDNLINALEELDDEFINEALSFEDNEKDNKQNEKIIVFDKMKRSLYKITAIAACIALVILGKTVIDGFNKGGMIGSNSKSSSHNDINVKDDDSMVTDEWAIRDDDSMVTDELDIRDAKDGTVKSIDIGENYNMTDSSYGLSEIDPEDIESIDDIVFFEPYIYLLHNNIKYYISEIYFGDNINNAKNKILKKIESTCTKTEYSKNIKRYFSALRGNVYSLKDSDENKKLCICYKSENEGECYVIFESK